MPQERSTQELRDSAARRQGVTTRQVAEVNSTALVAALRRRGPLTLQQLREATGLSPATITRLVDRLRRDGVVVNSGVERSTGGRPPVLVAFNPRQYSVVGLDVGAHRIGGALVDLDGTVLHEHAVATRADLPGSTSRRGGHDAGMDVLERIVEVVQVLVAEGAAQRCPVRAIGVGVPGAVRSDTGVVQFAPALGWWDMPLSRLLTERTDRPVVVENDVNLIAIAEHRWGVGRGADDLLVIALGTGIGAALVLEGRLYRGHQGGAGEVGYTLLGKESLARTWPGFGDFETRVSELQTSLRELAPDAADWAAAVAAIDAATPDFTALVEELADTVALVCANAVSLLNPRRVVLGGSMGMALGDVLVPLIADRLRDRVPWQPEFAVASVDEAERRGAAQLADDLVSR